jgi:hypothetical protein
LLAVAAPSSALAATGSISGTVTDASSHLGIEGVRVCAEDENNWENWECRRTAGDGSYEITGLETGAYIVEFRSVEGQDYRRQYYDGKSYWEEADPVTVAAGDTSGIDAELAPAPSIQGTVTATEDGLPAEEVEVCAFDVVYEEYAGCEWTGADGSYSIQLFEAGEYKVEFWPAPSGRNLALQFWDHENRWAEADTVSVAEGETKTGIDADLAPGAAITGHVSSAATGLPLEEIRVCSIDAPSGQLWTCTWTNENGNYGLRYLSEGAYKVVFSPELSEWFPGAEGENDGFPTQFWNNQSTLAAANVISFGAGGTATGVDARLGSPAVAAPPVVTPPVVVPPRRRVVHKPNCKRGFKVKKVKGKYRCVKVHRHKHRRHGRVERPVTALPPRLLSR